MTPNRLFLHLVHLCLLASITTLATAQGNGQKAALSGTVSVGDVVRAEDKTAILAAMTTIAVSSNGDSTGTVITDASPIHLVYVHGINEIGPNDSSTVPNIPNVRVVNLPAKNSSFRIPRLMAGPTGVHDNCAKNQSIVRAIFLPTTH